MYYCCPTTPHKLQGRGWVGKSIPGIVWRCVVRRKATAAPSQLHAVVRPRLGQCQGGRSLGAIVGQALE
jgi:hypothetical protein